jgi:DNA-directed RNA polymerase specialized sigma24 family protein
MTADLSWAPPGAATRAFLSQETTRRRLSRLVRRRVPADDADDVVQSVLCDVLAAERVPTSEAELSRWLAGVVRHKICDHHRQARRQTIHLAEVEELTARPAPLEARELLRAVASDAERDARSRQTFDWTVREAEGHELREMAREAALTPASVRQRVSRLRRLLRSRWLRDVLLVTAAAFALALSVGQLHLSPRAPVIVAEPAGGPVEEIRAALRGPWRIERIEPDSSVSGARRALLEAEARIVELEVTRGTIAFVTSHGRVERSFSIRNAENGEFSLSIEGTDARATWLEGDRLLVTSKDPGWPGRVVLTR